MIEFLHDYETKALPPESFKKGDRHSRSEASEQYLVGLGVAAYATKDGLVDLDHRPIETAESAVLVVTPGDRRFSTVGRAGELAIGIDTPQRATTGPGNAALFGGDQQTAAIGAEVERLTAELASAIAERDSHAASLSVISAERNGHAATIASLTGERDTHAQTVKTHAATIAELKAGAAGDREKLAQMTTRAETAEAELTNLRAAQSGAEQGQTTKPVRK